MQPTQLLVISFILKLLSRKNLFNNIKEKHGNETVRLCRQLEKSTIKYGKVKMDLDFLLTCKKENLIPAFAKPKLSIAADRKLRLKIAKLIVKTEIKNKHGIKKELSKKMHEANTNLKSKLSFSTFYALKYKIANEISYNRKKWSATHKKKVSHLRSEQQTQGHTCNVDTKHARPLPPVIHNFSRHVLSDHEIRVLSKTLDHYIPDKTKGKRTEVEFERFYVEILSQKKNISSAEKWL